MNRDTYLMPEDLGELLLSYPLDNFRERSSLVRMGVSGFKLGLVMNPLAFLLIASIGAFFMDIPLALNPWIGFLLFIFLGSLIMWGLLTLAWYRMTPEKLIFKLYTRGIVLNFVPERYSFESRFLPFESIPCITKDLSYGEEYLKIGGFFTMEDPFYLPSTEHDDKILIAYMVFKAMKKEGAYSEQ